MAGCLRPHPGLPPAGDGDFITRHIVIQPDRAMHIQLTRVPGSRHPALQADLAEGSVAYVTIPGAVRIREAPLCGVAVVQKVKVGENPLVSSLIVLNREKDRLRRQRAARKPKIHSQYQ